MVYEALPNVQPGWWWEWGLLGFPTLAIDSCAWPFTSSVPPKRRAEKPSCLRILWRADGTMLSYRGLQVALRRPWILTPVLREVSVHISKLQIRNWDSECFSDIVKVPKYTHGEENLHFLFLLWILFPVFTAFTLSSVLDSVPFLPAPLGITKEPA